MKDTLKKQKLTPEWRTWVRDNLRKETPFQSLVAHMIEKGFDPLYAMTAVQILKDEIDTQTSYVYEESRIPVKINYIETSDRIINIRVRLENPSVAVLDNVLSQEECDELINLSNDKLYHSLTFDSLSGSRKIDYARTSKGVSLPRGETDFISRIERRISEIMNWPLECAERLQIINYKPTEEYKRHFDYFTPSKLNSPTELSRGGQRVSTLVVYLNDVEGGGATSFPAVGLSVQPKKGSAVYFEYCNSLGQVDPLTLHAGDPVLKGEKWIITQWMRQGMIKQN